MNPIHSFIGAAAAFGLGALTMYICDPQQGRRRRAVVRDKLAHYRKEIAERARGQATDLSNRTQGLAAEARGVVRDRLQPEEPAQPPESAFQLGR